MTTELKQSKSAGAFSRTFFSYSWLILLFILVAEGALYGASFLKAPQYRAEVQIEQPNTEQLGNFVSLYSTFLLVNGDDKNSQPSAEQLAYQQFKEQINSVDNLKVFWQQSAYYQLIKTDNGAEDEKLLQELIQNSQSLATNGNDIVSVTLSNPKRAKEALTGWVEMASQKAKDNSYNSLVTKWKNLFTQVRSAAEANLDGNWQGKLKMMRSVQPLDNNFQAYRVKNQVSVQQQAPIDINWYFYAGGIGILFGLLMIILIYRAQKKDN